MTSRRALPISAAHPAGLPVVAGAPQAHRERGRREEARLEPPLARQRAEGRRHVRLAGADVAHERRERLAPHALRPRHGRPVVGRCGLLVGPIRSTYLSALPHRKSRRYGRHLRFNDHLLSSLWRYKVLCHHILTKTVDYLERPYYHHSRHRRRHGI